MLTQMMGVALQLAADSPIGCETIAVIALVAIVLAALFGAGQRKVATNRMDDIRARTDFHCDDVYVSPLDRNGLAIDRPASRILLARGDVDHVFPAAEIVSVEVMADDTSLVRTNRGSQVAGAAVGGLLLGPVGLLLGGLTGSTRSEGRIKRLTLRVITTDFSHPNHDILLYKSISGKGDKKDSLLLCEPLKVAETWNSRVAALIREASKSIAMVPLSGPASVADELRKLADLHREGLLTESECQKQKQLLLTRQG